MCTRRHPFSQRATYCCLKTTQQLQPHPRACPGHPGAHLPGRPSQPRPDPKASWEGPSTEHSTEPELTQKSLQTDAATPPAWRDTDRKGFQPPQAAAPQARGSPTCRGQSQPRGPHPPSKGLLGGKTRRAVGASKDPWPQAACGRASSPHLPAGQASPSRQHPCPPPSPPGCTGRPSRTRGGETGEATWRSAPADHRPGGPAGQWELPWGWPPDTCQDPGGARPGPGALSCPGSHCLELPS